MKTPPKKIDSPQNGIHKNLSKIVKKHIEHDYQQPIRKHNIQCFESISEIVKSTPETHRILDSCCGTGMSSHYLAAQNKGSAVIGIDQSEVRLAKNHNHVDDPRTDNLHFFRANCEDIWRLCVMNDIRFETHTLFYPNPYPKSTHLKRRWHGHAVFPYLPKLAKKTILRSNWQLYLEEFAYGWEIMTGVKSSISELAVEQPITLFEKKYSESGQAIYEVILTNANIE